MCRTERSRRQPFALVLLTVAMAGMGGSATPTAEAHQEEFDISIAGKSIIYQGSVTHAANQFLFSLVEKAEEPITSLEITSVGGDADAGMELGHWVFESQLDVYVPSFCGSSCANYIFPAARRKLLDETAMVAWHGGATQADLNEVPACEEGGWFKEHFDCDAEAYLKQMSQTIADLRAKEEEFFKTIGVDQRITTLGQNPEFACDTDGSASGWYYSIQDLKRLGVENVEVLGDEWTPQPPSAAGEICRVSISEQR